MTNSEIIFRQSMELLKQGVLKPTGKVFVQEMEDGTNVEVPEPEPIHTYNGWKELGYQAGLRWPSCISFSTPSLSWWHESCIRAGASRKPLTG